jgi:hypothetical protein
MQIILVNLAPHKATLISMEEIVKLLNFENRDSIRTNPYPPSFSKIAASTMDPAIGASTWAFGNHKWTENIGNFTRNPAMATSQKIEDVENFIGNVRSAPINSILVFDVMYIDVNITSIGNEAVTV